MRVASTLTALALLLAASGARGASADFAAAAPRGGVTARPPAAAMRLRLADLRARGSAEAAAPRAIPKALGDRLVISYDDDNPPVGNAWEARLDVAGGPAGASDAIAVRFPAQALAVAPPFDVSSLIVGLDDRHGVATWPVELWLEDAAEPLQPRRGTASVTGTLDAAAAGLVRTAQARPTSFQRIAVPLRLRVPDAWLSDGAFDDDFSRSNGPLGVGNPDWIECEDGDCTRMPLEVDVSASQAVRRTAGGGLLVVKLPAFAQETQRPHQDIDVRASVRITDGAAGFTRAGLAVRAAAGDMFYRVEYQKTPSQVVVTAVVPPAAGTVPDEFPVGVPLAVASPSSGTRLLEVTVTGATPAVTFAVSVDGAPVGTITDAQYRLTGWYAGLSAGDPAATGVTWDDFRVERRPDVFAVVAFPPGEDAGLPLDASDASVASRSVLATADGATFAPLSLAGACTNPGNPFVQLEVEDSVAGDRLFRREARVVAVSVACPTCPFGPIDCPRNLSIEERVEPTLTTGVPATARVRWRNEHLDDDTLIFAGSLWTGPCDAPITPVAGGVVTGLASAGQGTAGIGESDIFAFTPGEPGPHCLVVIELHDSNGDCCPDGEETVPLGGCPGACSPVPPTDSNPATAYTLADLQVFDPCALPKGEDVGRDGPDDIDGDRIPDEINLDGASLRVGRGAGDEVVLRWGTVDALVFPATYNVHLEHALVFDRLTCYPDQASVVQVVVGATSTTLDLPVRAGEAAWLAVFETDGCAGEASVPDASADDPALGCP